MSVVAKGPPYFTPAWEAVEPLVYTPPIPELEERHNDALASLLKEKAPWEKNQQIGGTHYSDLSIQPWDAMRAWMSPAEYIGYHVGTIIGYLSRHKAKGGEQDLQKAGHHMDELRRYLKEDEEYPF